MSGAKNKTEKPPSPEYRTFTEALSLALSVSKATVQERVDLSESDPRWNRRHEITRTVLNRFGEMPQRQRNARGAGRDSADADRHALIVRPLQFRCKFGHGSGGEGFSRVH